MKRLICITLAAIMCVLAFTACSDDKTQSETVEPTATQDSFDVTTKSIVNVRITMNDGSEMDFELYPDIAPITVQNFVDLCSSCFYDGLTFHRLISGFMIQGGDPLGTGLGGSDKKIKGEFSENGVANSLSHTKGVISMARQSSDKDSATSQFFIVLSGSYTSSLDGKYAAFGKMTSGFNVLSKLSKLETNSSNLIVNPPVIKSIRVIGSTDAPAATEAVTNG